jgi:hypothetical protein
MRVGYEIPILLFEFQKLGNETITASPVYPESQAISSRRGVKLKIHPLYCCLFPLLQNLRNETNGRSGHTEGDQDPQIFAIGIGLYHFKSSGIGPRYVRVLTPQGGNGNHKGAVFPRAKFKGSVGKDDVGFEVGEACFQ